MPFRHNPSQTTFSYKDIQLCISQKFPLFPSKNETKSACYNVGSALHFRLSCTRMGNVDTIRNGQNGRSWCMGIAVLGKKIVKIASKII